MEKLSKRYGKKSKKKFAVCQACCCTYIDDLPNFLKGRKRIVCRCGGSLIRHQSKAEIKEYYGIYKMLRKSDALPSVDR